MALSVLYEDESFVAINKAANVLVIPAPGQTSPTLTDLLRAHYIYQERKSAGQPPEPVSPLAHPCHRLDRETSGAILFAKGKAAQKAAMDLFFKHEVEKVYLGVVNGLVGPRQGVINSPIEAKTAQTHYKVLHRASGVSVMMFRIMTGRTNQIRIHCAAMGHALLGDTRFGRRAEFALGFERCALHSLRLGFKQPFTHSAVRIFAPLSDDLHLLLASLGLNAPVE